MNISPILLSSILLIGTFSCSEIKTKNNSEHLSKREVTNKGRSEFEHLRLQDPETGEIPENIRARELAFASTLPKTFTKNSRESNQIFEAIGPRNVGGRTRAVSFHSQLDNVVLAGGVSGGMWRSTDLGLSWKRATSFEDQSAVSCVVQDQRPGKTSTFYYGSGESTGNSASKSFSANYHGSGMYKSTDDGATWTHMASTLTEPQKSGKWSYIYNIALDNSRTDKDIIYAATSYGIQRSEDGGASWTLVLGGNTAADYTDVVSTSTGIVYAHITSDGTQSGFWRSPDGITWTNISPSDLPSNHERTLMAIAPSNENIVYYYTVTPNSGSSDVSFWKYEYLNGDGSGSDGNWSNRSNSLPSAAGYSLNTQGTYCMSLIVKPDNENMVFLGGTNLFRSDNGFANTSGMRQIGGYNADGYSGWDMYEDNQHPDQQSLAFRPQNPNHLLAGTDGGVHFSTNPTDQKVIWQSFNNGYQTMQFYGIALDHLTENEIVTGGFQDNGSWWTNSADTSAIWKFTNGADGAFCALEKGTENYYFSSQYGVIRRVKVNSNGDVQSRKNARPQNLTTGYLFVHPYILNPTDNNQMYMPNSNSVWRNDNLSGLDNNQYNWTKISTVVGSSTITAIAASEDVNGIVYVGSSTRDIFKVVDDGTATAISTEITDGITSGTYTSNIEVDPHNSDNVLVVFSNYNVISMWSSTDAGLTWSNVEGNLKGDSDPGVPPSLSYLGNGPSFRWAKFIHTPKGRAILLGTSIGLFATNNLDGENTEWVQQASDVIGNVVIEQIDYRESDGFCVVGTHGAGAYKTYFNNNSDITSVNPNALKTDFVKLYPNPVLDIVTVEFSSKFDEPGVLNVMDASGKIVLTQTIHVSNGLNTPKANLEAFPKGIYYASIQSQNIQFTKAILKN